MSDVQSLDDQEFLAELRRIAENWRYSDEFIGIVVRHRYPRDYSNGLRPSSLGAEESSP